MYQEIDRMAKEFHQEAVSLRRDFHKYAERGWLEMRTSAKIAEYLSKLGYEVLTGRQVCKEDARIGVPEQEILDSHFEKVKEQGVPKEYLTEDMKEGFTGVIGILKCNQPGPVMALRFDIDALGVVENGAMEHRPCREGFASVNEGQMHACGHDTHITMGLGTAVILMKLKDQLCGTVKLIFQPAEEGTRGARSITEMGHLDDVDYFAGTHITPYSEKNDGDITVGSYGSLATTKYDVSFTGKPAHAGSSPEKGASAITAAAHAIVALNGIPRHSQGMSRVNVGVIHGGTGRNVVADRAFMEMEVRGETTEINEYMTKQAEEICQAAAAMTGCQVTLRLMGQAPSQKSDEEMSSRIKEIIENHLPQYTVSKTLCVKNGGSEDIGYMMNRVQEHGGQAVYMKTNTHTASGAHTSEFDVDEADLDKGISVFCAIVYDYLKK